MSYTVYPGPGNCRCALAKIAHNTSSISLGYATGFLFPYLVLLVTFCVACISLLNSWRSRFRRKLTLNRRVHAIALTLPMIGLEVVHRNITHTLWILNKVQQHGWDYCIFVLAQASIAEHIYFLCPHPVFILQEREQGCWNFISSFLSFSFMREVAESVSWC